MSKDQKPNWWPKNPYPIEIFPNTLKDYTEIIPLENQRTAISGCLGRHFWELASESIFDAIHEHLTELENSEKETKMGVTKYSDGSTVISGSKPPSDLDKFIDKKIIEIENNSKALIQILLEIKDNGH